MNSRKRLRAPCWNRAGRAKRDRALRTRFARGRFGSPALLWRALFSLAIVGFAALPAMAQADAADTPVGTAFRWLNFLLVFGALAYVLAKFGRPYFRKHAKVISGSIREALEERAAAERELAQATERLSGLELEIQELRRASARETAAEAERIRALARSEVTKVGQAGAAEIAAAERAARQELRVIASRLAIERAAVLVRARLNPASEAALFNSFVNGLAGSAR